MYAVVRYNDYRKEQDFEIIATTTDVEYAKKIAFNKIKENIQNMPECKNDDELYKIETDIETDYFQPINKEIVSYRIIKVKKCKNKLKKIYHYTTKYAVVEFAVVEFAVGNSENLEEIDTSLICDDYGDIIDDDE
jgi:hypothetical protein